MFLTQRVIRRKSIAICVASRDAITQYIGTTEQQCVQIHYYSKYDNKKLPSMELDCGVTLCSCDCDKCGEETLALTGVFVSGIIPLGPGTFGQKLRLLCET